MFCSATKGYVLALRLFDVATDSRRAVIKKTMYRAAVLGCVLIDLTCASVSNSFIVNSTSIAHSGRPVSLGAFVWYNYYGYYPPSLYSYYPAEIKTLTPNANGLFGSVRVAYMPQGGSTGAPVNDTASMKAYVQTLYTPKELEGAKNHSDWLTAAGVNDRTVLVSWNPPGNYMKQENPTGTKSTPYLPVERVEDYAAFVAESVSLLVSHGVAVKYIELSNEPDGDWNCRIYPAVYAKLVKAARAQFDQLNPQGKAVGIAGPGLYVLDENGRFGWKNLSSSNYFAALKQEEGA
jgi:hypothetical protein